MGYIYIYIYTYIYIYHMRFILILSLDLGVLGLWVWGVINYPNPPGTSRVLEPLKPYTVGTWAVDLDNSRNGQSAATD